MVPIFPVRVYFVYITSKLHVAEFSRSNRESAEENPSDAPVERSRRHRSTPRTDHTGQTNHDLDHLL